MDSIVGIADRPSMKRGTIDRTKDLRAFSEVFRSNNSLRIMKDRKLIKSIDGKVMLFEGKLRTNLQRRCK
jgi:hypothetical protein